MQRKIVTEHLPCSILRLPNQRRHLQYAKIYMNHFSLNQYICIHNHLVLLGKNSVTQLSMHMLRYLETAIKAAIYS